MEKLKITIDQLKNYLGTELKIGHPWGAPKTWELHHDTDVDFDNRCSLNYVVLQQAKPIVYRLSDLDKEIEINGERFVPMDEIVRVNSEHRYYFHKGTVISAIEEIKCNDSAPFGLYQKLFEWHFWPFGDEYFEKGLVIDKMTL